MIRIKSITIFGFVAAFIFSTSASSTLMLDVIPESNNITLNDVVNVQLSLSGISSPGLALMHLDLSFDTSVLSLNSASVGDFVSNNPGSQWYDPGSDPFGTGLSAGDAVFITATSVATVPDVLGFDFLELNFVPSLIGGVLINLEFTAIALGNAGFSLNDVLFLDNNFADTTFISSIGSLSVVSVPDQTPITLMGIGIGLLATIRRKNKTQKVIV